MKDQWSLKSKELSEKEDARAPRSHTPLPRSLLDMKIDSMFCSDDDKLDQRKEK